MRLVYRPIDVWPGQLTPAGKRRSSPFDAEWPATLDLLEREVRHLGAGEVIIQVAMVENDFRLNGEIRAQAIPAHPGAIVSFASRQLGPLRYSTDVFTEATWKRNRSSGWQANVRAIALGLEALRRVDRYGIAKGGEQYVGWRQIGAGTPMGPAAAMSVEDAARFLIEHGEWGGTPAEVDEIITGSPEVIAAYFRHAAKRLHPDVGGDPALFRRLQEAKTVLEQFAAVA